MEELRDACRNCGEPLRYVRWTDQDAPEQIPREERRSWMAEDEPTPIQRFYSRLHWEHQASYSLWCDPETKERQAQPANYCIEHKNDGDVCMRPINPEYVAEGIRACGTHARMVRERMEAERRNAEYAARRQEERELAAMEAERYVAARLRLEELGAFEFMPELKSYRPLPYEHSTRVQKDVNVNVLRLLEFVEGTLDEPAADGGEEFIEWEGFSGETA